MRTRYFIQKQLGSFLAGAHISYFESMEFAADGYEEVSKEEFFEALTSR